ncbi:MAG: ATP-binding protein [Alteraurantiacibacter sp.]
MLEHLALALSLIAIAGLALLWVRRRPIGRVSPSAAFVSPAPPAPGEAAMLEALCQDFRARTNGIVGLAELLVAAPLAEDQQHQAELIADSGRTMIRLLGDVLDVTRIDAAGLQLQAESTDLREVLEHHVNLMRASARARGLALSLMVDDAVPPSVLLDRTRLRQVLLNLIGNAIKFTERGSIDVQARLAQTASGPQLAISIVDPGAGIARERQAEIFQPFFRHSRVHPAAPRTTSGTGLGLALSSRIVEAMGGEIALESAPGLGSCFTVRLPMIEAVEQSATRELAARYRQRKDALFAALHAAVMRPTDRAAEADWTALATQLQRLAGVAANFGDEPLGTLARRLHGELRSEGDARKSRELLVRNWAALQAVR